MAHSCRIVCDDYRGEGRWARDGDELVLSPVSAPPFSVPIGEVGGIEGDGFNITLKLASGSVRLEKLGGDGPTLLQELRRDWPLLRAKLLRLAGSLPSAKTFGGVITAPDLAGPFRAIPSEDRLMFALDGHDLACLFLADCQTVAFDEASYAVNCKRWDGNLWSFARLAGETQAFASALQEMRNRLAEQAQQTIARYLPTLQAGSRAKLAYQWLSGRVLSLSTLESLSPGFAAAFASSWLHAGPREDSGLGLMKGVAPADTYLGYRPEGDTTWLWLLVRNGEQWSLELLSQGDYATYLFKGGEELPKLIEGLVRLPEFSREALYLPLEELVADRAAYAIAARDLPLLRDLRARFAGRRIHATVP